ncbi:hypothetical protein GCM10010121_032410 [Streptomyces brasiliensis]|uniref:Uncharacterized protein n=1 Tax=Streptomyces brasiliensis TaxID=1954 RepID=A0A917KNC0_9ACTN|nr:hypothetical protein GCM10010121_032410 [Streptomyces brasiliensis]
MRHEVFITIPEAARKLRLWITDWEHRTGRANERPPLTRQITWSEGVSLNVAAPGFEPGKAEPADLQTARVIRRD